MVLRDGAESMTLTGELAATPLPDVDPERVEYVHVLPNLLISPHPDYIMTHRLVPLSPDNTWIECSWYALPNADGSTPDAARAVELDLTNKQDFGACESVQRGSGLAALRPRPVRPERGCSLGPGRDARPGVRHRPPGLTCRVCSAQTRPPVASARREPAHLSHLLRACGEREQTRQVEVLLRCRRDRSRPSGRADATGQRTALRNERVSSYFGLFTNSDGGPSSKILPWWRTPSGRQLHARSPSRG